MVFGKSPNHLCILLLIYKMEIKVVFYLHASIHAKYLTLNPSSTKYSLQNNETLLYVKCLLEV
jgi:hypothetical protein